MSGIPPPPPPPPGVGGGPPPPPPPPGKFSFDLPLASLPQTNVPKPKSKMKTLQWQKIPVNNVIGKPNIWTIIGHLEKKYEMDYKKMDELFSLNHDSGVKRSSQDTDGVDHKRKRENVEINILDGKRSLNVNIFLKQFRMEHEEIVRLIREGRCEKFGAERLRSLLKLLPSQEEIDAFNGYSGHTDKLGNAEKFFMCLMKLPNYRMRIEGLLIMEEFNINMEWIRPSIEAVIQAAKDIQESQLLKELIYLILISGNYLNSGNYAGNAAGFKLSSLLKLTEIRANKPGMNLMHYVALEAEVKNPKLLRFPQEMSFLKDAAQVSIETLTTDINNIASKVRAITEQIVVAGMDFQQQMAVFLKEANVEVSELEDDLSDIEIIRQELATFFCEDIKTFQLEECFNILKTFCERLKKATEENAERRLQEDKAEKRRKSEARYSPRPDDQHMNSSIEEQDDSIVDMLLADVRSGYASRKFNDGNFSITKVTKVNLNSADVNAVSPGTEKMVDGTKDTLSRRGSYGRLGQQNNRTNSSADAPSPTPDSLTQTRTRRSYSSNSSKDDESLIDFLMDTSESLAEPSKPETHFERYASLRRRRLERKAKRSVLTVTEMYRERAPSPLVTINPSVSSSVQVRNDNGVSPVNNTNDLSKSEKHSNSSSSNTIRRTRSFLDQPSGDKTNTEQRRKEMKDDVDETDALIKRIKQRLNKKDGHVTPPAAEGREEETAEIGVTSSSLDATPLTSRRRRTGISASENNSYLETINEKNPSQDDLTKASQVKTIQRSRERTSNRFRNSLDPAAVNKVIQNIDNSSPFPKHTQDDCNLGPSVMVSMRKRISSGMGTDIDGVLKTIEDTGRQIDTVGVTGPMKRTPDSSMKTTTSPPQVAIVAHVTASNIPSVSINDQDLKVKRDKRKQRSTLSVDDVKAAMKLGGGANGAESVKNVNGSLKSVSSKNISMHKNSSTPVAKTLPTQAKLHSVSNKNGGDKTPVAKTVPTQVQQHSKRDTNGSGNTVASDDGCNLKEPNKAAKLAAARKKFRGARFGFPGASDINASGRARSNVESDSVDQALKEIACQSGMSRSKSYDEHVAKSLAGEDFASNSIMRMNSGSAPDTSAEKCAVMRNSMSRLSMDGRRNGLYIPSDDSDTELKPEDVGTRRSSKSDSQKSFSQLSLKSVNTSTETIPAESESSAEKNTDSLSHAKVSVTSSLKSDRLFPNDLSASVNNTRNEHSPLRRSYSLIDKSKNIEEEGDSDNPLAAVAKWRMKRAQQRKSVYDNVKDADISPAAVTNSIHYHGYHSRSEENDLKNEAGSRNSYASSDRDEGFESASGTMSQRTSMNSNLEAEVYNTPVLARRTESHKSKSTFDSVSHNKSVINATKQNDYVISRLSEVADRKERTENWTEQTVRVNTVTHDPESDINSSDFCNVLSPDSGHSTSKEDIWCDDTTISPTIPNSASKQKVTTSSAKKITATENATKFGKPKSVPSYMLPTSSTANNRPIKNKQLSTAKTDTSTLNTAFIRDSPSRTSARDPASTPTLKRDVVRASMKAETAAVSFQRGTLARTSIRGPRSSVGPSSKSLLSPPSTGRARSDSNASISSATSSTSNISTTPLTEATKRRLTVTSNTGSSSSHPTKLSTHPTKPATSSTVPVSRSTPTSVKAIIPASHNNKTGSALTPVSGFSRTQSMRVTSGRTSLGHDLKQSTPNTVRRSVTPVNDNSLSTINAKTILPERPQSTIPFASEGKPARRSSFMTPTAASKAKVDEQTPVAPPRTKSPVNDNNLNTTTVSLPERPHSTIPFASEGKPARKSSFMTPTAASKAKVDEQMPVAPPRTKSLRVTPNSSSLTRSASLRVPKNASGRKSPVTVDLSPHHNLEQHHTLSTVDEQGGSEGETTLKRSQSFFKRISTAKGKITPQKTASTTQ